MDRLSDKAKAAVTLLPDKEVYGEVTKILGLLVEIVGFGQNLSIGSMVYLRPNDLIDVPCEVVGFRDGHALLMPFGTLEGIGLGCKAVIQEKAPVIRPDDSWLGRVINGRAEAIDGLGPLRLGGHPVPLKNKPPPPHSRQRMGNSLI